MGGIATSAGASLLNTNPSTPVLQIKKLAHLFVGGTPLEGPASRANDLDFGLPVAGVGATRSNREVGFADDVQLATLKGDDLARTMDAVAVLLGARSSSTCVITVIALGGGAVVRGSASIKVP